MASNLQLQAILNLVDRATAPLRQIAGGSSRAAAALKATREQVKALQRQQGDIHSFKQLSQGLSDTQRELVAARDKVNRMRAAVQATSNPSAKMLRELNQATEAVKRLKQAETDQTAQLNTVRQNLQRAGIDVNNLSQHERELADRLRAANRVMEQQQERLRRLNAANQRYQQTMQQSRELAGKGTGMLAAGAATGAVLSVPIKAYADNEDAATQLRVAMMKASGQVAPEFEQINALATKLGNSLPGTTADFQNMMAMLVKQGMSFKAILGGVGEASGYLAVQMKMPFEEAAEFAAKLQDATKTAEGDMMGLMDTIQRTYYLGVDKTNMLSGFAKLAAGMKTIKAEGLKGAQAMAPLLVMADQAAMAGEAAGNAYSKIFAKMMDTGNIKKQLDDYKKATGQTLQMNFTNGKGEFGGLDNMFKQLAQLKTMSTEARLPILSGLFGNDSETIQALNLLIDKGQDGYNETLAKMSAQADLQKRVNQQLGTLKNLWDSATGTFTNAMANFGEAIAPELKALTTWLADVSEGIGNWAKENPMLANSIMKFLGLLAITLVVLGGLTIAVAGVLVPFAALRFMLGYLGAQGLGFIAGIKRIGQTLSWLGSTMLNIGRLLLANPILLIITAIAVAALLIYVYWNPIKSFFTSLWNDILYGLNMAATYIQTKLASLWDYFATLKDKFMTIGGQIIDGLWQGISAKWEAVKAKVAEIGDSISNTVKEKLGIKSPSRVFAEIGLHTMTGLEQGLAQNQSAPLNTVMGLTKQLKQTATGIMLGSAITTATATPLDTRPPLSPRAPIAATGDSHYNITIHAATGMDEKKLADLVMQQIKQHERQKQSRQRSSLLDID
ncbi:MAG: phage tail tape measure protein [Moraxellaceae bacterium]|nr:phage tail tape measure protein [Moraxellaceae bacterium]